MSKPAGSYAFGTFQQNENELDRLKQQASISLQLEKSIWNRLGITPDLNILDCACGPGVTACELAGLATSGSVVGFDINQQLIEESNALKNQRAVENLTFQQGSVYDLPFHNEFDFAYARFLFQHLEKPGLATQQLHNALRDGGRLCVIDVDDRWLTTYPASEVFEEFAALAANGQRANGGDRHVGRKLGQYMHDAGFRSVKTEIIPIGSHELGMKTFLDITTGFKLEQFPDDQKEKAAQLLKEIYQLVEKPYSWGAAGVFVVIGEK